METLKLEALKLEALKRPFRVLRRRVYEQFGNPKYSRPSLNDLDKKLEKYLNYRNGFFIEVGANNGYCQSNTYYLERMLGWRGILVEAIPELYERCKRERKRDYVYNCALVAKDYTEPVVEMHFADLMSVVEGSMKTDAAQVNHIQKGLQVQKLEKTYRLQVPARTLESILDDLPDVPPIDFFSLDVEGYELNVLQGLNIERYRPKYILVEAWNYDEINQFLSGMYTMFEQMSHHDYLFKLRDAG